MKARFLISVWVLLAIALWALPAAPADQATPPAPPEEVAPDELGRGSPRGAVSGFLQATVVRDYRRAAGYLDLRGRPAAPTADDGPTLARKLRVVLDNTRVDVSALPDEPDGRREPGMRAGRQTVSFVDTGNQTFSIVLERVPREDGLLIWQFSRDTLKRVPDLYWKFSYGLVGQWLPPVFVEYRMLGLALWQWLGLTLLAGVSYLVALLAIRPGLPVLRRLFTAARLPGDAASWGATLAPIRTLVALAVFRAGQSALALPVLVLPVVSGVQKVLLILALTWMALHLVATGSLAARHRAIARAQNPNFVDLVQRALRICIGVIAALLLFEAVGVQPTTLIAAVGVGGIGIALAAQRTVENLFSGLVLIGDQPVRVGDFCRIGPQQGTVEQIGLWSTRIRTPERSVVSIPNAQFFTLQVDNYQQRDRILFNTMLRLRYGTTPEQLRAVLTRVGDALRGTQLVDRDSARVRLMGFGGEALEVEVFAYLQTTNYDEYVAAREQLCLTIMDIVASAGTAFALPERTIYLREDGRRPVEEASGDQRRSA